jgi:hypothetical protein
VTASVVLYKANGVWVVEVTDGSDTLMFGYQHKRDAQKRASIEQKRLGIKAIIIPFPLHRVSKRRSTIVTGELPTVT